MRRLPSNCNIEWFVSTVLVSAVSFGQELPAFAHWPVSAFVGVSPLLVIVTLLLLGVLHCSGSLTPVRTFCRRLLVGRVCVGCRRWLRVQAWLPEQDARL